MTFELDVDVEHAQSLDYFQQDQYFRARVPDGYADDYEQLLEDGRAPRIAAAVTWYVAGQRREVAQRTQREVADVFGLNPHTIRDHYSTIAPTLDPTNGMGLVDPDILGDTDA